MQDNFKIVVEFYLVLPYLQINHEQKTMNWRLLYE